MKQNPQRIRKTWTKGESLLVQCCQIWALSTLILLHRLYSLSFCSCFSVCLTVGPIVWLAVTDVLYRCFSSWKKKKTCLVLHMSALFLELLRSWPHYTDLHTPFLSLSLTVSLQVNSRMQMSTFSQGAGWLHEAYKCMCARACVHEWVLLAEGMRG